MIRPFIPLISALAVMIFMLMAIDYHKLESSKDREKVNKLVAEIQDEKKDYILTIGSSTHDVGNQDKPFPMLLQSALDKQGVSLSVHGAIIHGGLSRLYYKCLEKLFQVAKQKSIRLPKLIIVEVNPRGFSAYYTHGYYNDPAGWSRTQGFYTAPPLLSIMELGWGRWITTPLPRERFLDLSRKMRDDIFNYYHLKYSDYYKADSIIDLINLTPVIHPIGYKLPLIGSYYGGPISKFLLDDWKKLALLAEKNNVPILFYITPINTNFKSPDATSFYRFTLNKNRQVLISALSNMGAINSVDLSGLIDTEYFLDCEHLKPPALQQVANRIANEVIALQLDKRVLT
ncbi:MAG: hypothetical protein P4M12_05385 [Gammaproteobacteria bacterium]|nr:hypothetical protein [Gammaproteobacteria bacterium]